MFHDRPGEYNLLFYDLLTLPCMSITDSIVVKPMRGSKYFAIVLDPARHDICREGEGIEKLPISLPVSLCV